MILENMEITFNPSKKHLNQIEKWLIQEQNEGINDFYYNFDVIKRRFDEKTVLCLLDNNIAVGYLIYYFPSDLSAKIDIANIKNDYTKKGYGKFLLDSFENFLIESKICAIELDCSPEKSQRIWKKLGFKEFAYIESHRFLNSKNHSPWLYKILCNFLKPSRGIRSKNYVEIWDGHNINKDSIGYWNFKCKKSSIELIKPIVYPIDPDWNIKCVMNGVEIYNGSAKRFRNRTYVMGYFLMIKELS